MAINTDKLLLQGQEARQRQQYLSKLFEKFGDWIKERQIKIAERDLVPVQEAIKKITTHSPTISVDRGQDFPVVLDTGIIIDEPTYTLTSRYYDSNRTFPRFNDFDSTLTSTVVVKARGHKIVLQGGTGLKSDFLWNNRWEEKDRILARGGTKAIIRYLGQHLTPS